MTDPNQGTWMIYYDDYGPRFESIHTDVQEAIRIVASRGYGKVGWLPYGVSLDDAVKVWESHEPLQITPSDPDPSDADVYIQWRDSVLPTVQSTKQAWEALAELAGATGWQKDAIRYFLSDTVSASECGDYPAPCNHDPAHPKESE